MLAALGCTSFLGATLPPGASGGVFFEKPKRAARYVTGHAQSPKRSEPGDPTKGRETISCLETFECHVEGLRG